MLPSFCVPGFQYGADVIIGITRDAYRRRSIRRAAREWSGHLSPIKKRHIQYYLSRLRNNRILLQFGINEMSPVLIRLGTIAEDKTWTKCFLEETRYLNPSQFNTEFHCITGKSFMSAHKNIVA